ncbi:MAG: hypothetical protein WKF96_24025 [Solirubrobacteraceae bacterium]
MGTEETKSTRDLPAGAPDEGKQLSLLLDTARHMADEEFRRSERLDLKSRNQFTAVGALFAIVMATTAGVLNALLKETSVDRWVYPVLGGCALASIVALGLALTWSVETWRLRKSDALDPDTLEQYVSHAERGNVAVAKNLVAAYAQILRDRRTQNSKRVDDLKRATVACGIAAFASLAQLAAVFVALIEKWAICFAPPTSGGAW